MAETRNTQIKSLTPVAVPYSRKIAFDSRIQGIVIGVDEIEVFYMRLYCFISAGMVDFGYFSDAFRKTSLVRVH